MNSFLMLKLISVSYYYYYFVFYDILLLKIKRVEISFYNHFKREMV